VLDPRFDVTIPSYIYSGCYTEATSEHALTRFAYFDGSMTVDKCAGACDGFDWFGVSMGVSFIVGFLKIQEVFLL